MANGAETGEENYERFVYWAKEKSDSDFTQLERRGVLCRAEIAKECGFGLSALRQNPRIKSALNDLEKRLRVRGILPPVAESHALNSETPMREKGLQTRMVEKERVRRLEQDLASARQEIVELKRQLSRYSVLQEALAQTGRVPR